MALFTDSPVFGIAELAAHETSILDTAATEGIDLTAKIGLARDEIGLELLSALERQMCTGDRTRFFLGCNRVTLTNVVVTPALRLWQIFHTLEIVYRDAYHNQLNDRYQAKQAEYKDLAGWTARLVFETGIGTVADAVPEADQPELSEVPGTLGSGTYFVRVAWVNAGGEEGAPGALGSLNVDSGNTLRVRPVNRPTNGTGWNVYVGMAPEDLYQQNVQLLDPAVVWIAPATGLLREKRPGTGQAPTLLRPAPRILQRG